MSLDTSNATQSQTKEILQMTKKQTKPSANKASKSTTTNLTSGHGKKADDIIGITVTKEGDFSTWYQEVVLKSEMIDYYNEIAGFYILRPRSMFIWDVIRKWFTDKIDNIGVQEASFPMFLSMNSLTKEKDHIEGFAPELAWVTKA